MASKATDMRAKLTRRDLLKTTATLAATGALALNRAAKLTSPSPVVFYMFSGPDFLYANAFFPNASTYVMSGLEPIGSVPDLTKLSRDSLAHGLSNIEESLNSILRYSFFQTIEMRRVAPTAMELVLLYRLFGECRHLFFGLSLVLRKGHPFANDFSADLVVFHSGSPWAAILRQAAF